MSGRRADHGIHPKRHGSTTDRRLRVERGARVCGPARPTRSRPVAEQPLRQPRTRVVGSPFVPLLYRAPNYRVYVPHRAYPYGWRPYGYRPGWSLNFYFGRPHVGYGVGGYYPPANYGYYAISPGVPYGSVRIVDAPRDAQVFVDGYYAGVVDDYDGVFQHLNLEPGAHHIEIQSDGFAPIGFECGSSQARRSRIARTPTEDTGRAHSRARPSSARCRSNRSAVVRPVEQRLLHRSPDSPFYEQVVETIFTVLTSSV